MAALPYIQLYVADYLADTQHLTTEEHGAYMLLIFSYWQTGKPLRIDRLATVARLSNERWANVEETLKEFFHVVGQHWHHFRIDADLEAVNSKTSKASDAGKASAKARALKKQQESNERSTDVETNDDETYQRNGNHTDTDTDTDTDTEEKHGEAAASASTTHLVEFDGVDFKVSAHLITKWEQAFPAVNVELEIERAAVWAISNPNRAKKDWRKFLSNWLAKASPAAVPEGTCPVDKIIDLYHQSCPNLPAVSVAGDKALRSMIVERWNESPAHQSGQNFWQPFFLKANRRSHVFYRGQNVVPRLEALVSRAVFREIAEAAA